MIPVVSRQAKREFGHIRLDTYLGMGLSNLVTLFIIIATAQTVNAPGITHTSSQAAKALKPMAGDATLTFFATRHFRLRSSL